MQSCGRSDLNLEDILANRGEVSTVRIVKTLEFVKRQPQIFESIPLCYATHFSVSYHHQSTSLLIGQYQNSVRSTVDVLGHSLTTAFGHAQVIQIVYSMVAFCSVPLAPARRRRTHFCSRLSVAATAESTNTSGSDVNPLLRRPIDPRSAAAAVSAAAAASDGNLSPDAWRRALSACVRASDSTLLLEVLSSAHVLDPRVIQRGLLVPVLRTLAAEGRWEDLRSTVSDMWARGRYSHGAAPDERLIAMVANFAVDAGRMNDAMAMFEEMRVEGVAPQAHSYSVMFKALGRVGDLTAVRDVLGEIETSGVAIDSVVLNSAADALIRCGAVRETEELIARERFVALCDTRTYNILIKGFTQNQELPSAFRACDQMREAGCSPNEITHNTLIAGCVQKGDYDRAWQLAKLISAGPGSIGGQINQLTVALTSMLTGLAESGRLDEALQLLTDMESRGAPPTSVTYAALLSACFRQGDCATAESIFDNIPYVKPPASPLRSVEVYNSMITGLCRQRKVSALHKAIRLVRQMHDISREPSHRYLSPSEDTYNALVDGCVRCGDMNRAERLIKIMSRNRIEPSIVTFTILIRGYGELGAFDDANRIFQELRTRGIAADKVCLNAFISACAKAGKLKMGFKLLENMEKCAGNLAPNCYSYSPLIAALTRRGMLHKGWDIYSRMKRNSVQPNEYICEMMANTTVLLGKLIVLNGSAQDRSHLAKNCCELLADAHNIGINIKVLRKWRRRMLAMFGRKVQLKRELSKLPIPDLKSASEEIFEQHGWNEIDSGWRIL